MLIMPALHTCDVQVGGEPCGRCVCCNDHISTAANRRYDSAATWHIAEHEPGIFTLYNERLQTYAITDDWDTVLTLYRDRPRPVRVHTPSPPSRKGASRGGISAAEKAANTARLLAALSGASHANQ